MFLRDELRSLLKRNGVSYHRPGAPRVPLPVVSRHLSPTRPLGVPVTVRRAPERLLPPID
jgi:hypothetical protein